MTYDEALAALGAGGSALPVEAMRWIDAHWDEVGVKLVRSCEAFLDGADMAQSDENAFFFAIHLAGARRARRLHAPLCGLLLDGESTEELLGDATTITLPALLVATFDDDLAPMHSVIEATTSDEFAAGGALIALATLAHEGRIPLETVGTYLGRLFAERPRESDFLWIAFAIVVASLHLDVLAPAVETLFREGSIDRRYMRLDDFRTDLAEAKANPASTALLHRYGAKPLTDAVEALSPFHSFDEGPRRYSGTILNPMKDVGRNDPCPCGSGKKYKKCCLQAA